ncbi:MAG: hypothetical protein CR987_00825 [Draconibacterium sp.]|nr:MAG: hypothetical protein CR987_00825 [Draconibacterium sp.]
MQEHKFARALKQSVALDKRTGKEEAQILSLALMAAKNKKYKDANDAFGYILDNKSDKKIYNDAWMNLLLTKFAALGDEEQDIDKQILANDFKVAIDSIGYNKKMIPLIKTYAHLLAFHLNEFETATKTINNGLRKIRNLTVSQKGILKSELADVYAYSDDPWEATLLYSQVIEQNKKSSLGDDVKLKKAKLSYYMGNFEWAKAQLDVLKASTSKLTANDAMDLSILISNNLIEHVRLADGKKCL